jgi:2,4-dienoyl-CoA reductase-like NADH-dependent reductase (Old Yellow Enzyme family)
MEYRRVATFRTGAELRDHLDSLGVDLPFDEVVEHGQDALLARPIDVCGRTVGNRFAILPMEGWDGTPDGRPSELTFRRWRRFGSSGAKLIWGGEAVAVRPDGRANPRQLCIQEPTAPAIAALRLALVAEHEAQFGSSADLLVGLQLTHSGRFARPLPPGDLAPMIAYHHPPLAERFGLPPDPPLLTDDDLDALVADFVTAAVRARDAGYDFVDVKHCHGYLGHELLSARSRPGRYGGSFENRTRFLRDIVAGIRAAAPELGIGVRLSAFDLRPFQPGPDGTGEPIAYEGAYPFAFGGAPDGLAPDPDLADPKAFLDLLAELGVGMVCLSAASPYYNPHLMRPAFSPPSDGYQPPEDPLVGVARIVGVTAALKRHRPDLVVVGSGYSYLQEWLPQVAQHAVRTGAVDVVGLGRMVLSYPDFPADVLAGRTLRRKHVCRTFSDCTTGPRNGMVSGCYPLDDFYKATDDAKVIKGIKKELAI